eukprot:GGOE01019246.1.p1 GENE.GGOE01019246.1~~GGOE01019246.1.p1  ORF type:complete len:340 (-),score=59.21 GGOE01019246.1:236-1255(-)
MPVDSFEQQLMGPAALAQPLALPTSVGGGALTMPHMHTGTSQLQAPPPTPPPMYMVPPVPAVSNATAFMPNHPMVGLVGGALGLLPSPLGQPPAPLGQPPAGLWPPGLSAAVPHPLSVSLPNALPTTPAPLGGGLVFPNAFLQPSLLQLPLLPGAALSRPQNPRRPADASGGAKSGSYGEPCEHRRSWKRLRAKRGVVYFLCQHCHAKWRVRSEDQESRGKAEGHERAPSVEHCMQYGEIGDGTVRMGDRQGGDDHPNGSWGGSPPHADGDTDRDRGRATRYKRSRSEDESDDGDFRDAIGQSPLHIAPPPGRSPSPQRSPNLRFPLDYGEPDYRSDSS